LLNNCGRGKEISMIHDRSRRTVVPKLRAILMAVLLSSTGACVTTGTFDKKVAELDKLRADHDRAAAEQEKALQKQIDDDNERIRALTAERDNLQKKLDDTTALAGELRARLEKLGQNVDKLTSEKGQLSQVLADAKARLEELRKQKAAAEARAATFRNLVARLRSMIDAGRLKVVIRDGRMLIALPNDVLFDSGKTAIKPDGQAALAQVAHVLATIPDRHFLVAGDTDDVPIHTARFPSNWELSTARAVEVTKFLVENGMKPQVLAAAGYGEFDPVVANDSPEHRAQNRRIEIVLQPNLADLPSLDDIKTAP
jgi:chemotaxis protein MotB